MQTVSINVENLCVPCANRCRYCLLSYDGKLRGVDYGRSEAYARRFYDWLRRHRPDLSFAFYFGYSMEHPQLLEAIDFAASIGSPAGEFLQFDGMAFHSDEEIHALLSGIQAHGVKLIDLTFYGTRDYHDRFAARPGDFDFMLRILRAARDLGLSVQTSIPVTKENLSQVDELMDILTAQGSGRIFCFIPHEEGRGVSLSPARLEETDLDTLSETARGYLNRSRFRPEREWVAETSLPAPTRRVLTLSLTPENVDYFESLPFDDTIRYLEKLDDDYYAAIPSFRELLDRYGDPQGTRLYSARDLYLHYQRRYIQENNIDIYDINDERQHFSRRI